MSAIHQNAPEAYSATREFETIKVSDMPADGFPLPVFEHSNHRWRIVIFPKGYKDTKDYLSVFVMAVKIQDEYPVTFKLQTIGGNKIAEQSASFVFSKVVSNRGINKFIPLWELDEYLVDGKLKLSFTIDYSPPASKKGVQLRKMTGYVGLNNSGATCYMNAALQTLFHIPAFRRIIFSMKTNEQEESIPLNLQKLFCLMQYAPLAPSTNELTKSFGWGSEELFMQHDFQEFLRVFLTKIEETGANIASIFKGKILHIIKTPDDQVLAEQTEEFYDLSVMVKEKFTLENAIQDSLSDLDLSGNNQYQQENGEMVNAVRSSRFVELPPILHIHFERFTYDQKVIKIMDRLTFPQTLDMSQYIENKHEKMIYELFGIIVHAGDPTFGHYFAYCRPTIDKKWFLFNDNLVRLVDESTAINNNFGGFDKGYSAYFLVYIRQKEISAMMDPIMDQEVPQFLKDYLHSWVGDHTSKPEITDIAIYTVDDYQKALTNFQSITDNVVPSHRIPHVPINHVYKDLVSSIKKEVGIDDKCHLYQLDQFSYPYHRLNTNMTAKECNKLFAISASNYSDDIPFVVAYFDPNQMKSLQFMTILITNAGETFDFIKQKAGISEDSSRLKCFIDNGQTIKEVNINHSIGLAHGMIVFQLNDAKIDMETLNNRSIDYLPVFKNLISYPKFKEMTQEMMSFHLIETNRSKQLDIRVSLKSTVKILLKCLRVALGIDSSTMSEEDEPVQESEMPKGAFGFKTQIIDKSLNPNFAVSLFNDQFNQIMMLDSPIEKVISNNIIYFQVEENISQGDLENSAYFKITIVSGNGELIAEPLVLMPKIFKAKDLCMRLVELGFSEDPESIVVLQIAGERTIQLKPDASIMRTLGSISYTAVIY